MNHHIAFSRARLGSRRFILSATAALCGGCNRRLQPSPLRPVGGWENVGRYWGVIGRAAMPWSPVGEEFVDYRTAILIRRTARRYMRSKGIRIPHQRRRIMIVTDNLDAWLRVCEDACDRTIKRTVGACRGTWVTVTPGQARAAAFGPVPQGCVAEILAPSKGGRR
jgi:hypothetical protein